MSKLTAWTGEVLLPALFIRRKQCKIGEYATFITENQFNYLRLISKHKEKFARRCGDTIRVFDVYDIRYRDTKCSIWIIATIKKDSCSYMRKIVW